MNSATYKSPNHWTDVNLDSNNREKRLSSCRPNRRGKERKKKNWRARNGVDPITCMVGGA